MNPFEVIYRWFTKLFGAELADYLAGWNCTTEDYTGTNQFVSIGLIAFVVALVFMLVYYYVVNHPRFNRWWSWLLVLIGVGVINLFIGYGINSSNLEAGNIENCLMYATSANTMNIDNTQPVSSDDTDNDTIKKTPITFADKSFPLITKANCWGFGLANFIVSAMWFIIFSLCFKWWSRNCKYSPF
ncbi:MAG: hypothetical protein LBV69_07320 [Bacteroidales bacterium]|jgi:uncharacterized BrkB/YihY/UPF0761 family membrane protein|nr:hypothetical protein [Bacteroidales bacterium]